MALQVDLLKDKLGFDDAFNYKEESDLKSTLKRSLSLSLSGLCLRVHSWEDSNPKVQRVTGRLAELSITELGIKILKFIAHPYLLRFSIDEF